MRRRGFPTLTALLDSLESDIVCLQETKMTSSDLDAMVGKPQGWYAFYSFTQTPGSAVGGFSGVATFCRCGVATPVAASEGIAPPPSDGDAFLTDDELDCEGRCVVTDHSAFVLLNLYCPATRMGKKGDEVDEERFEFKLRYHEAVHRRVSWYLAHGRQVVIVGDFNVCAARIDHCDPQKWDKDNPLVRFEDTQTRRWMADLLRLGLSDVFRVFHPTRAGAFTCWNTMCGARLTNYGTRLDYIVVSTHLVASECTYCDICPDVEGSDHCPVKMFLRQSSYPTSESMPSAPPGLCAQFHPNCRVRQTTLAKLLPQKIERVHSPESVPEEPPSKAARDSVNSKSCKLSTKGQKSHRNGLQTSMLTFVVTGVGASTSASPSASPAFIAGVLCESETTSIAALVVDAGSTDGNAGREWRKLFCGMQSPTVKAEPPSFLSKKEKEEYVRHAGRAPLCSHGQPCVRRVVTKDSPNKGRAFWSCVMPVGLATNSGSRCDFFKWESALSS
jgi:AP endonuclease-2